MADTVRGGLERLRSLPGVVAAAATCCLPLAQGICDLNFDIMGRPATILSASQDDPIRQSRSRMDDGFAGILRSVQNSFEARAGLQQQGRQ